MTITVETTGSSHDLADIALCKWVYERLERDYPGHDWMIGANSESGVVTIDLPYEKPPQYRNYGYLLHIRPLHGTATAKRRVRYAGGELLERFGLPRGPATDETRARVLQNELDVSNAVVLSRSGGI